MSVVVGRRRHGTPYVKRQGVSVIQIFVRVFKDFRVNHVKTNTLTFTKKSCVLNAFN